MLSEGCRLCYLYSMHKMAILQSHARLEIFDISQMSVWGRTMQVLTVDSRSLDFFF